MPPDQITSIDQLAAAIEAAEQPEQDAQPGQEAEHAQPETEAQNDDQQGAGEGEEEQQQPVEGEGEQPATESLDDKVVSWETGSGEKFEVPVAELKQGYMRDQDYRHKTQNLAQERDEAVKQVHQQFQSVQTYAQELGTLHAINAQIAAFEQAIPTMDKRDDPISYFDAVTQLQQLKDHRGGVATRLQQVEQQRAAEQQQMLAQAQQKMFEEIQSLPGFGKELLGKLDNAATGYGYKPDEIRAVSDPRFVRMLHDAMQYQALQAKAPATVQKVKAAPIKPTKQASTAVSSGIEQQVKQFAKKKDLASFAALYQHTL
jgi:hypothetical protein